MSALASTSSDVPEWVSARDVADLAGISPAAARQRLLRSGIAWKKGNGRGGPKLYRLQDVEEQVLRSITAYAMWRLPECTACSTRLEECVSAYREQIQTLSEEYPGGVFPGGQWREIAPPACPECSQRNAISYTLNDSGEESVTWRTIKD